MGLDSYFEVRKKGSNGHGFELEYFRKHHGLHDFLAEEWSRKTKRDPNEFNCENFKLNKTILKKLNTFARNVLKDPERDYKYGSSTDNDWENTRTMICRAMMYLEDGYEVWYYASY